MQRSRITRLVSIITFLFVVIAVRLVWLQGFEWRTYHVQAEQQRKHIEFLPAPRGRILDRRGEVLAHDMPTHEIVYTLRGVEIAPLVAKRIGELLGGRDRGAGFPFDVAQLQRSLAAPRAAFRAGLERGEAIVPHVWIAGLSKPLALKMRDGVARRRDRYPGVSVEIDGDTGRIVIDPTLLFAGELGVRRVAQVLELDARGLLENIENAYAEARAVEGRWNREYEFAQRERLLAADVPFELVIEICYAPERFPGLRVREIGRRRYPAGYDLAQLVGYVGRPDTDRFLDRDHDIDDMRTFRSLRETAPLSSDRAGSAGLEKRFEERLRGVPGARIFERDSRGRQHGLDLDLEPPIPGEDVALTLDLELCRRIREILEEHAVVSGAVLVGTPRTGELLGWCSYPSFEQADLRDRARWQAVLADERKPLFDRPTHWALEPGSTFKLVLALGGLADGITDESTRELCENALDRTRWPDAFQCHNHPWGLELDVREALARSCNVYFYRLGVKMKIGGITSWGYRFGFWNRTGIEGTGEVLGRRPRGSGRSAGIGQSMTVTPLQMFRFICGLANRGHFPVPRILRDAPPGGLDDPLPAALWDVVIDGMTDAVEYGTAEDPEVGLSRFDVAVKTGTAEKNGENIGWIVGFAPVHAPKVAFVIDLEHLPEGVHGGDEAGPVTAAILSWLEEHRGFRLGRDR